MEKRYQVFVSSTFADLQQERHGIMQTLMQLDCIPAGMELFPAADEEQWAFIQKVIADCDYYLFNPYGVLSETRLTELQARRNAQHSQQSTNGWSTKP
jgi:hypothetical protein